jgi:AcrR family transcriptional regulator
MIKRALILEAAARLFGNHGYRGTTTRRIALEAGVSEVTLFRQFGTKDALLREALGPSSPRRPVDRLPEHPEKVERELVSWCAAYLRQLRAARKVIRKSMGEVADRPRVARRAVALPAEATRMLRDYLETASRLRVLPSEFDVTAAATILAGVLFADALARDLMPGEFPEPARDAHKLYVRFVLGRTVVERPKRSSATKSIPVKGGRLEMRRLADIGSQTSDPIERRSVPAPGTTKATVFDRRRSAAMTPDSLGTRVPSRRGRGKA